MMRFFLKFLVRVALNGLALYLAAYFLPNFIIPSDIEYLVLGGFVLALINTFIRPVLKIISFPLLLLSFGLFNIVIYMIVLLIANHFLPDIVIADYWTLLWASVIIGITNSII